MRDLSSSVAAARESASHQPLLDLMSSNARPKFSESLEVQNQEILIFKLRPNVQDAG